MTSADEPLRMALARAEARMRAAGTPWTADCERVLAALLRSPAPMKAYALLDALRREDRAVYPATVYRALAPLEQAGLVHRIASLAAFAPCRGADDDGHTAAFLICTVCGRVDETALSLQLDALSPGNTAFQAHRLVVEARGVCQACRDAAAAN